MIGTYSVGFDLFNSFFCKFNWNLSAFPLCDRPPIKYTKLSCHSPTLHKFERNGVGQDLVPLDDRPYVPAIFSCQVTIAGSRIGIIGDSHR